MELSVVTTSRSARDGGFSKATNHEKSEKSLEGRYLALECMSAIRDRVEGIFGEDSQ